MINHLYHIAPMIHRMINSIFINTEKLNAPYKTPCQIPSSEVCLSFCVHSYSPRDVLYKILMIWNYVFRSLWKTPMCMDEEIRCIDYVSFFGENRLNHSVRELSLLIHLCRHLFIGQPISTKHLCQRGNVDGKETSYSNGHPSYLLFTFSFL